MEALEKLVKRLEEIARKNEDTFSYKLNLDPIRGGLQYEFVCEETADSHTFVSGVGSLARAIQMAEDGITQACQNWGYKL